MPLAIGDPLPDDLAVVDAAGDEHALATATDGEPGLLIYLRHLG